MKRCLQCNRAEPDETQRSAAFIFGALALAPVAATYGVTRWLQGSSATDATVTQVSVLLAHGDELDSNGTWPVALSE